MKLVDYNCSTLELIAVATTAWKNFNDHLPHFTQLKSQYHPSYAKERLTELERYRQQKNENSEETPHLLNILLTLSGENCLRKWKSLKRYLLAAYKPMFQKTKLEAAGAKIYAKANKQNWKMLVGLMNAGSLFLQKHRSELLATNKMPSFFPEDFNQAKIEFNQLYARYIQAEKTSCINERIRIEMHNLIIEKLNDMLTDAMEIFEKQPAIQQQFDFDSLIQHIDTESYNTNSLLPMMRDFSIHLN